MVVAWKDIESSEAFQKANKNGRIKIASDWIVSTENILKSYPDYKHEHSVELGRFGGEVLKKIYAQEDPKPQGVWETVKAFGQDVAQVPSEFAQGWTSTTDQMRMPLNALQGDQAELDELVARQKAYQPLPEAKTKFGGTLRDVANMMPFMGINALAGFGGGTVGSIAGPAGTTAGAIMSAGTTSALQGWGEMYGRLVNEGIDKEDAKGIATIVAPLYAGIELTQLRKIPVIGQFADKYLSKPFKDYIVNKYADKLLKGKLTKALGKYAGEIIAESHEEGLQESVLNVGEQYGRNDGFNNFNWGENAGAYGEAFKSSLAPMALIQAPNMAWRLRKTDQDRIAEAIEEGKNIQSEEKSKADSNFIPVPEGVKLGAVFTGADGKTYKNVDGRAVPFTINTGDEESSTSNLDADAESESKEETKAPTTNQKTAQDIFFGNLDNFTPPKENANILNLVENQIHQQELQDELAELANKAYAPQTQTEATQNVPEQVTSAFFKDLDNPALNENVPLAKYIQMKNELAEAQARKAQEVQEQARKEAELDDLAEEDVARQQFENAKTRTLNKYKRLSASEKAFNTEKNELRKLLDSIPDEDVATKLEIIDSVEDSELLDDKDLEYALSHGREWANNELQQRELKREEESHDTLLDVMSRNGYFLPTPKAMKEKGGSAELYGEIKDLHDNLYQAGGKGRYWLQKFFRNAYASVDDLTNVLNDEEGFSYKSSDEFIRDFADNLAGIVTTRSRYSLAPKSTTTTDNAKVEKTKRAIETTTAQFYKNAHHRANVNVISGAELEKMTGKRNARAAVSSKGDIFIAGDKMENAKQGVKIMLHEYVGHFGLQKLLGKDLKPFLAYIIKKYKNTEEWNRLKETGYTSDEEIAEEMIAHLAEYRHLSDPSMLNRSIAGVQHMWNVLLKKVQKGLKKEGVSDAYVKLLDEETLKSAVRLSRQWSKGDLVMNNKGIWESATKHTAKEEPDDDKLNLSLQPKTRAELEAKHFGPQARNGNFDLANIDLTSYEGMDTKNWSNSIWEASWEMDADIDHFEYAYQAIDFFEEKSRFMARPSVFGIERLFEVLEKAPSHIKTDADAIKGRILSHKELPAEFVFNQIEKSGFAGALMSNFVYHSTDLERVIEVLELRRKKTGKVSAYDWARITAKWQEKNKNIKLPDRYVDMLIAAQSTAKADVLSDAIGREIISDKKIRDLLLKSDDKTVGEIISSYADNEMHFNFQNSRAIEKRLKNGWDNNDITDALTYAMYKKCFYGRTDNIKNTLRILSQKNKYYADKIRFAKNVIKNMPTAYDYTTNESNDKKREPQDLRDKEYYDAIDSGNIKRADDIIRERQNETEYNTDAEHTSKAHNIDTFKLNSDLAKKYGENVKAYGYGAYMATNPDTTEFYRNEFKRKNEEAGDEFEIETKNGFIPASDDEQIAFANDYINGRKSSKNIRLKNKNPKTYEIAHDMKESELLLWDKPLGYQNEDVAQKLHSFFGDIMDEEFEDIFDDLSQVKYNQLMRLMDEVYEDKYDFKFNNRIRTGEYLYRRLEDIIGASRLSRLLTSYGIRGIKYLDGRSRKKGKEPTYNYVSFEGGSTLKRRETITRDSEGKIIPPSERFNPQNENWNFSLINENNKDENGESRINLDVVDKNRGKKISVLLKDAKDRYEKGESKQEIFKATGWELMDVGKGTPEWIYDLDEGKVDGSKFGQEGLLPKFIKNEKLFEVCPFLKDVKVNFEILDDYAENEEFNGGYNPDKNEIVLDIGLPTRLRNKYFVHEIQHAIDCLNYAGTNVDNTRIIIGATQVAKEIINDNFYSEDIRNKAKEFYQLAKKIYKLTDRDLNIKNEDGLNELAFRKYQAHFGEMMARNAEKRHRKQNRDGTLISDTIDRRIKHKIYITESTANNLLDFADLFSDVVVAYEEENRISRHSERLFSLYASAKTARRRNHLISKSQISRAGDSYSSSQKEEDGFNYSLQSQDELDAKHKDLYERYKTGDKEAYEEAVELVKADAERKGYTVKVYHGTKSDRFNIADATSSHEENGEGNQAHGAGLYMAVSRNTAEDYRFSGLTVKGQYLYKVFGPQGVLYGFNFKSIGYNDLLTLIEDLKRIADNGFEKVLRDVPVGRRRNILSLRELFKKKGISENDLKHKKGSLFDWFTNLDYENIIYEDITFQGHSDEVQEKLRNALKELSDMPIGREATGGEVYDFIVEKTGSQLKASQHLLKHGIKGLTYNGRQDGRCYVSFEGGATIKLQDPFTFDDNGNLIPLSERFNEGNADMRFSLEDSKPLEKYDGRFGKAQRKYKKLLGQKSKELERHIEYDDLPDIATDDEFKSVVGMTKKEYADLMQERDRVANEMRHVYQKLGQKFKQAEIDRYNPIKIIERIMNGGDLLGAEKSAYKSLFTAGNMDAVMYNAIYVGLPQYDRRTGTYKVRDGSKPLIAYFEKVKGKKYDNFQKYAQAVAMLEHYARSHNLETIEDALKWADSKEFEEMAGFSKAEAQKWIDEATQDSKDTVDALQELFKANREFMVETGLASAKQAEILNSFDYYLPMLRQFEDADTILSGDGGGYKSRGFSGRTSGVKEFVGSKAKIKNVMESIIERSAALYANGYKNVAMQRNIQMLSEFGLAKHAMKASVRVQARIEQAKNALEREGIKVENVRDESELIPLEAFHIINSLDEQVRDNIVSVRSNGNLIFYHIADPELLVALKSLGAEQQKLITSLFTGAKNIMTWGVTKLPAFAVRNFLRDTGSNAIILGNNPAKSVVNFAKSMKDTPQMQKIRMAGMGGAFWYPVSSTGATLDFGDGAWKKTKRIGKYILTPFRAYDRILQASEQANRITAYDKAIAEGLSEAESAFRASDVLNFGMSGSGVWTGKNYYAKSAMEILSWLIRVSPFVNAGIQGLFKAYREAGFEKGFFDGKDEFSKKAKAKRLMQALNKSLLIRGSILASASVLYSIYANSSDDDDGEKWYEKLPEDEKLSYWHFYVGNNKILRLPKPFEIGYLFSTIPTAMTDAMLQDNPDTAKILWRGMTDQLRFDLTSNPIMDTAIENWRNKDSFRKTPIVQHSDLNLPARMQYSSDTSSTAKALSIIPNMIPLLRDTWASSPARVQNMLDNFFGGMSQYGTYLTDSIVESFSSIEGGTSRYARKTPVERAYEWSLRDTRTMRYKNAEKFYELKGRIDELYASARLYKQTQQLDKLQELIDENTAEFGNYEIVNALNTKLREIATKRRKLGETKTYSVEEMIELDDKLLAERNKLLNYTDIIIERIENGEYNQRDLREIKKRIDNAGKSKKESKKADRILKGLR